MTNNNLNELAHEIHVIAQQHGWWEPPIRSFGELISLCHAELSEALEEHRNHNSPNEVYYDLNGKNHCRIKGDVCYIQLKQRNGSILETMVDIDDVEKLKGYMTFYASFDERVGTYYCKTNVGNTTLSLHRIIAGFPDGFMVDHINHDTLDNRKENLRITTSKHNQYNLKKQCGIHFRKDTKKWMAYIYENKKRIALGSFETKEEAIKSRNNYESKFINHPENISSQSNGDKMPLKCEGIPIELADVIIRILDMCGHYGINIEEAVRQKIEYNKTREYKHGGKKI